MCKGVKGNDLDLLNGNDNARTNCIANNDPLYASCLTYIEVG